MCLLGDYVNFTSLGQAYWLSAGERKGLCDLEVLSLSSESKYADKYA